MEFRRVLFRSDARLVQIRREQLGQRRGYRLEQRVLAHETHIGVDGEAGGGKNALERAHALLVEADAFGQDQPAVDAAAPLRGSIVVDDAADPFAPEGRVLGAGQEARILQRNTVLVIRSEEHTSELQSLMRLSYAVFCLK